MNDVHCTFHEVQHPTLSKDPAYFLHKYNGPGLSYELALHVFEPRLVWIRKNPVTKHNDRKNFVADLRNRIPDGKKAIADRGYRGKGGDPKVAVHYSLDSPELKTFKARARMRQETFNNRIKRYAALTNPFRHSETRHQSIFEAICVVCCYEMELVSPLFEV